MAQLMRHGHGRSSGRLRGPDPAGLWGPELRKAGLLLTLWAHR